MGIYGATGCRGVAVMSSKRQARKARPVHPFIAQGLSKLREGCPFLWMSEAHITLKTSAL